MPNIARLSHHLLEKYRKLYTTIWSALPHIPEIKKIIMGLELNPINQNWQLWSDPNGYIIIYKNKKIKIKRIKNYNDYTTRDLYKKSPIPKLISLAKLAIWQDSKDSTTLWLLCNDNKIRALTFSNNSWSPNLPPLSLPFFPLILLFKYRTLKKYKFIHPFNISPWPPQDLNNEINLLIEKLSYDRYK